MSTKSQQLQIRVSAQQKASLKRLAAAAGQDVSSYVLARALPPARLRFENLIAALRTAADPSYTIAELNDFLWALSAGELREAMAHADLTRHTPFSANYVAAMVEQASYLKGIQPPRWTAKIEPLATPWFATPMPSLRMHLMRRSPVPFRRRNLFVDAGVGDRV